MVAGSEPGGQLMITTDVENCRVYRPYQGPFLMEQMKGQAENVGTEIIFDMITDVNFDNRPLLPKMKAVILTRPMLSLSLQGQRRGGSVLRANINFKVLAFPPVQICDGFFFRDKEVCVVGGGNSG